MLKRLSCLLCCCCVLNATSPDAATKRWWSYIEALASDKLQGRDTGSAGYVKAESYVIGELKKAGLEPAGSDGFKQAVPLHALRLDAKASPVEIVRNGTTVTVPWFRQVTTTVHPGVPTHVEGPMYFVGDAATVEPEKIKGAVVVTLGVPRIRMAGSPAATKIPEQAAAAVTIDSLGGPEPPIWPLPYTVSVTLRDGQKPTPAPAGPTVFRFNPDAAAVLFAGSGHSYDELLGMRKAGGALPNFALAGSWRARLALTEEDFSSDNIVAVLPGSDPELKKEYVVVSAHLDGYGIGEARHGDSIYNGAFDDAAYVALLLELAQSLHDSGKKLKRSLLFCIVTGEEKGLLGSKYFAAHPTVPHGSMVADLNLDQVRAIFPLKILTTLALKESSLGQTVQEVAKRFDIRIQEDPEPERNLLRRSDHFSFMQIGVPAVNFVFGYEKGSAEEKIYRQWYAERYHSPADDLQQPWVPEAAAKFNQFYSALVEAVADGAERPHWAADSKFGPGASGTR